MEHLRVCAQNQCLWPDPVVEHIVTEPLASVPLVEVYYVFRQRLCHDSHIIMCMKDDANLELNPNINALRYAHIEGYITET